MDSSVINPNRWWILFATTLCIFMASFDMNSINVALPTLMSEFQVEEQIKWVVISYSLAIIFLTMIAGRLSDRIGHKRIMLYGLAIFMLGSVLCGFASSLMFMVIYRIIQGLGAALFMAPMISIIAMLFPVHERGKAVSLFGLVGPLGGAVGPSVGGYLIEVWNWEIIFWVNIPLGILCFVMLLRLLPKDETKEVNVDYIGAMLVGMMSLCLVMGLDSEPAKWGWFEWGMLISSLVFLVVFLWMGHKNANAIVPISLLKHRPFFMPAFALMFNAVMGSAIAFIAPFYLKQHFHMKPFEIGTTLFAFPIGMMVISQISGFLTDKFGAKWIALIGHLVSLAGLIYLAPLTQHDIVIQVWLAFFIIGFGMGLSSAPIMVAIMVATPAEYMGVSGAMTNLLRTLANSMGPAIATVIWIPKTISSLNSMQDVIYLLIVAMILGCFTTLWYQTHSSKSGENISIVKRKVES